MTFERSVDKLKTRIMPLLGPGKEVEVHRRLSIYHEAEYGPCIYGSECHMLCVSHVKNTEGMIILKSLSCIILF